MAIFNPRKIDRHCEIPSNVCIINAKSFNDEAGTVKGGGFASKGMTLKVQAVPDIENNWMFTHWSENGEEISLTNPYQFAVEKDRNLVANFDNTYKLGRDWFKKTMYSGPDSSSSATPLSSSGNKLIYNPHTQSFFTTDTATRCREIITMLDDGSFRPHIAETYAFTFSSGGSFTMDEEGNFWYVSNSALKKYDIQTKSEEIIVSKANMPSGGTWVWAAYGNGVYVLLDSTTPTVAYSHDAVKWTLTEYTNLSYSVRDFRFMDGYFVILHNGPSSIVYMSIDGITWKGLRVSSTTAQVVDICHMYDDKFFVCQEGRCGIISYSDGTYEKQFGVFSNYSADPAMGCVYADGMFVVFRSGEANSAPTYYYGTDAENLQKTSPLEEFVYSTKPTIMRGAYGNGIILVLIGGKTSYPYSTSSEKYLN